VNVKLLIDEIVRQTTVLIAQLSTSAGLRAPLSQVADQVFLELARELDAQGVRRKVVADMFGMALRTYQMKVRRLSETAQRSADTLWQQLYADLLEGSATRSELEARHRPHTAQQIASALQDMVQSGLAHCSGRGPDTLYGLTSDADRQRLSVSDERQLRKEMCWYLLASGAASSRAELAEQLRLPEETLDDTLRELREEGHLLEHDGQLQPKTFEIAVGAERGWETAVLDHFRAVTTAIGAKVSRPVAAPHDEVGGGTRSFLVHAGHPHAAEVHGLLAETRRRSSEVWQRVATFNEQHPPPENAERVTFYFGQHVIREQPDAADASFDSSERE
jgi:hypothetical protein